MVETKKGIPAPLLDEELLELYKNTGDQDCSAELYRRYFPLVFGVCYDYLSNFEESEDETQNIFIKKLFEKEIIQRTEINNFRNWLHTTTKNHCLDILKSPKYRNRKKNIDIEKLGENVQFSDYSRLDELLESDSKDINEKLKECIEELLNEQKECIMRFYYKKECYERISTETGYDKVKSYIQNGRRNLKNCINSQQ